MNTTAITAFPLSYSKACDTFRPRIGQEAAIRTGLGGKTFAHFFAPGSCRNRLIFEHCSEGRPTSIKNRLRHVGFSESGSINVAYCYVIKLSHEAIRQLVMKIIASVRGLCVNGFHPTFLVGPLGNSKSGLSTTIYSLRLNPFAGREGRELLQSEIDTESVFKWARTSLSNRNIDNNIEKPIATGIAGKARAVSNLPLWKRSAIEDSECFTVKSETISLPPNIPAFDGNPSKRFSIAAIPQEWALSSGSGLLVCLTNRTDGSRVYAEFFAASACEFIEVKSRKPVAIESKCVLLPIVAKVPNEIHRSSLLIKEAIQ